jgi:hypothetical protein
LLFIWCFCCCCVFGSQFSGIIQIIFHKDEANGWKTSTFLLLNVVGVVVVNAVRIVRIKRLKI